MTDTKHSPLVSVIIPCWNAEAYVGEAIESALAQTYPDVEVIVIDDGSTDGSLEVVRSFGERIRWETGPNRGAPSARNRGLALARGELVQFLDADDLLHRDKLEKMVPDVLRQPSDLLYSDWEVELPSTVETIKRALPDEQPDPVVRLLAGPLAVSAGLHRKEYLHQIGGFRPDLPCSQERDLHLRLACSGISFRRLGEVLVRTRRLPNSLSSDASKVLEQHQIIFREAWQVLVQNGEMTEQRALAFSRAMARDARFFVNSGNRALAERYFEIAREMHPDGVRETYRGASRMLHDMLGCWNAQLVIGWKQRVFR